MFAEGAAGLIALFLESGNFPGYAAEGVDQAGIHLRPGGELVGGFLQEKLGDAGGGGLKADFGQFGGIFAAEVVEEVILFEVVLENEFLLGLPFEVAAVGPVRNVLFGQGEAAFAQGVDDVLIGEPIGEHTVDHVALGFRQASHMALAAAFAILEAGGRTGNLDDGGRAVVGGAEGREQGLTGVEEVQVVREAIGGEEDVFGARGRSSGERERLGLGGGIVLRFG